RSSSPPRHLRPLPTRRSSDLAPRETEAVEAPDHERTRPARFLDHVQIRPRTPQCLDARLELDPRQRGADADVNAAAEADVLRGVDRKSTRLNSSHEWISYAVF